MPSLPDLPAPALLSLWEHVLGDLPTHVALAQTCRPLRAAYEREDDWWRAACFVAGFGRPQRTIAITSASPAADDMSWKSLACVLVQHAAICEIGSCIRANACFGESVRSLYSCRSARRFFCKLSTLFSRPSEGFSAAISASCG